MQAEQGSRPPGPTESEVIRMPSPFPGMDPYFEGDLWTTFHTQFGVEIARQLTPKLAPRYIARAEKRYIEEKAAGLSLFHLLVARRTQTHYRGVADRPGSIAPD